jgi:hypothetical protein
MRSHTLPARAVANVLIALVNAYRYIPKSPVPRCRFYPTCSEYALVALERHGASRGSALAVKRILRCHPFNTGGVDHVPVGFEPLFGQGTPPRPRQGAAA